MSYSIEVKTDLPVVLGTFEPGFAFKNDMSNYIESIYQTLDAQTEKVYYVMDCTDLNLGFQEMLESTQMGVRGKTPPLKHPNVKQSIVVVKNRMLSMAASGLKSASFGNIDIQVFETLGEAYTYIQNKESKAS